MLLTLVVVFISVLVSTKRSGARCSSVVVSTHGVMGRWIDSSLWTQGAIYHSSQCSTTGVTKAVVCAIMMMFLTYLWDGAYKRTHAVNRKE